MPSDEAATRGAPRGPGTIVFDLDGVLHLDRHGIAGAGTALRRLAAAGFDFVFATNNSAKTPSMVARDLEERIGFSPDPGTVVTSGMAAGAHLATEGPVCMVLGAPALVETLESYGLAITGSRSEAGALVVGLDPELSYRGLAEATLAVQAGATLYATNVDPTYPTPEGLVPGAGAIVAAITTATGVKPFVCGKPHGPMRSLVRALVRSSPVWVVGDRLDTDIALGDAEGWSTVLVLSGVTARVDETDRPQPDVLLDSVADLPSYLGA